MTRKIRTAVVGLGRMGLRHLEIARSAGLGIVGAADIFEEARQRAAATISLPQDKIYSDPAKMLEALRAECVIVATTAPSHAAIVKAAAANGAKFILCEKPMAASLAECDSMIEACRQAGARLAVNHQMRFMDQYVIPKKIAQSETLGGLRSITAVTGNIGLAMNGTHYFEMVRFMTDDAPAEVSAWFSDDVVPNPRGAQFEDRAGCVRLTTKTGKRFYLDASSDLGFGMHVSYGGRFGRIDVDELAGRMRLVARNADQRDQPTTRYGLPYETREQVIEPADVYGPTRAVLESLLAESNYPDGADGRMAVEVLVAAYVSHESGGNPVKLGAPEIPLDRHFPWA